MNIQGKETLPLPILGTPLLYKVNESIVGKAVAFQNKGSHTLAIQADDFGQGTVVIEWSLDGVTWNQIYNNNGQPAMFSENYLQVSLSFCSVYLRASLINATNPKNLTVTIG